LATKREG